MKDVTISARVPEDLSQRLTELAEATKRSRSYLIEEALRSYFDEQLWQVGAIREALEDYQGGNAKLVPHKAVMRRLKVRLRAKLENCKSSYRCPESECTETA